MIPLCFPGDAVSGGVRQTTVKTGSWTVFHCPFHVLTQTFPREEEEKKDDRRIKLLLTPSQPEQNIFYFDQNNHCQARAVSEEDTIKRKNAND